MAIRISDISGHPPEGLGAMDIARDMVKMVEEIGDLQHLLYAEAKRSLLVVFQGMDTSGKDGTARAVFQWCTPHGVHAYSFKKPTSKELGHDFLWRVHHHTPERGYIQIFNRSHYEDVLIQRVHKWIDEERVDRRFEAINAFEKLLIHDADTTILKFYLHIDKDRQLEKLTERRDDPKKNWKHNDADWEERKHWEEYMRCYEDMLNRSEINWHIIPANATWYRNYAAARIVHQTLVEMDPRKPTF